MITLHILSPEFSKTYVASAVFLPGAMGEFETLVNHAPIISLLTEGDVRWRDGDGRIQSLHIRGGVVRLEHNEMEICVD